MKIENIECTVCHRKPSEIDEYVKMVESGERTIL